ncbi:MAG TPA: Gfo/Idh/MocA family oxidoreductase [Burkholderiales bacterium]|nr:Gfo/Idh/MocA family oxidoreductase [Burkholderiales bacterium]
MIRAAIVGLGNWGQRLVKAVQGNSDRIRFTAGVTRTVAKAADFAKQHDFPLGSDYAAVLADPAIDAIVLATPHSMHVQQIVQAAQSGKPVYVEKPFALTRDSAEKAVQACRQNGVLLAVGFNRRFLPAVQEVKRLVDTGKLGEILHIEGSFSGPSSALRGVAGGWRLTRAENPGGGMTGKGIHIVDAMIHLGGGLADSVFAHSDRRVLDAEIDDTTTLMLHFQNGVTGYLSTILATPKFWRLHVFGSQGWAEIRDESLLTVCGTDGQSTVSEYPTDALKASLEGFSDAVVGTRPWPVTFEQAINGAAVLEAVEASARSGRAISLA